MLIAVDNEIEEEQMPERRRSALGGLRRFAKTLDQNENLVE